MVKSLRRRDFSYLDPDRYAWMRTQFLGGLLPRPDPEGFPVLDGKLGTFVLGLD